MYKFSKLVEKFCNLQLLLLNILLTRESLKSRNIQTVKQAYTQQQELDPHFL